MNLKKSRSGWLAASLVLAGTALTYAAEASWSTLEQQFRDLPMESRRLTGPLFWLHGDESRERLEMYVQKVAEGGNGCFTAESRPHREWLEEGWWRDLGICLAAAREQNLKMWIFDEKWWPSGEAGGMVPEQYGSKRLVASSTNFTGPVRFRAPALGDKRFLAAIAGQEGDGGLKGATLVDLSKGARDGVLEWEAPAGSWKVMQFAWTPRKSGSRYLVDGASKDAVEWYLRTVYQPHYDRFKSDFGNAISGYFYDEPETHGDWGTEVMKVLAERKVDWKRALVSWKFSLEGEEQAAARYQYQDALAEAWGRTLYGGITRWCREHRVESIGHFLEHGNAYLAQDLCAGNMFQLQKYTDMGGIDAVFDQFIWGRRVVRDAPTWQTPKLGSSISHAYGKKDDVAMVEIFGARGQDLTYPEMKWWADHMHVSGVNFLIPHSFNPRSPNDRDCPPYFYNGGFEPRWPLYRVFADYTSRLSLMLSGGRHVCPVAVLFLGGSAHVGKRILPDQISEALQDALYDCDWLPYEVFEHDMQVEGKELRLRKEAYKVLIVPPVEVIPWATLAKVKDFFDRGGVVIGHGFVPAKSATLGKTSADIGRLSDAIWGGAQPGLAVCKTSVRGGRSYLLPAAPTAQQLQQVLATDAGIHPTLEVIEGDTGGWLHVLHRVKAGRDVFFIANQNLGTVPRRLKLRLAATGYPECWDPVRDEITSVPHQSHGELTELSLTLEPNESTLLVFEPKERALPPRLDSELPGNAASYSITREPAEPASRPELEPANVPAALLETGHWIWFPEADAAQAAAPGERFFRKQIRLPEGRTRTKAVFFGTADNGFALFINGEKAGQGDDSGDGWRNPAKLDVVSRLKDGINQLAISAINASDKPNPAGLIGVLRVEFSEGEPLIVRLDGTWKAAQSARAHWTEAGFEDRDWGMAKEVALFGDAPWGKPGPGEQLTRSPVKADPFAGRVVLPAGAELEKCRVFLEMEALGPEPAASVILNGKYAGGVIGTPLRLDVSDRVRPGENTVRIEPFAPGAARLRLLPR